MRAHSSLAVIMIGVTVMFALLSVGQYVTDTLGTGEVLAETTWQNIGGWVGIVTAIVA